MKLEQIKSDAEKQIDSLDYPESIRTPGRTWTRYRDVDYDSQSIEPKINGQGKYEVYTGEEAVEEAGDKLFNKFDPNENKLNAIHAASINSIIYIKVSATSKISIVYDEADTFAHIIVETVGNTTHAQVTEEFRNTGVTTSVNEFYVSESSELVYGAIEASESELTYARRYAVLDDYGRMTWLNTQFRGELKRTQIQTYLEGNGSEVDKLAMWYPTDKQHNDISLHAYHRGKNTRCQMSSRAVVDDEARSVYEGMQHVADEADDTSSFQDEKVLTLSDKAEVDASPKLMIEDPNVEASHAASAGNLPEDELHYMESRGLSDKKASNLIVKGFFEPVMQDLAMEDFKEKVRDEIERKLNR